MTVESGSGEVSTLRERIAAVIGSHRPYGLDCKCYEAINSDAGWAEHVADAVVKALRLTEEVESYPIPDSSRRRWVSSWSVVGDE